MSTRCCMGVLNHYIVHLKLITLYSNWNLNKNLKKKNTQEWKHHISSQTKIKEQWKLLLFPHKPTFNINQYCNSIWSSTWSASQSSVKTDCFTHSKFWSQIYTLKSILTQIQNFGGTEIWGHLLLQNSLTKAKFGKFLHSQPIQSIRNNFATFTEHCQM